MITCDNCHCELGEGDCPQCHQVINDFIDLEDELIDENALTIFDDDEMEYVALTEFLLST